VWCGFAIRFNFYHLKLTKYVSFQKCKEISDSLGGKKKKAAMEGKKEQCEVFKRMKSNN